MDYTFTHDEHDVYVIDDFITKSECKLLISAYESMKGKDHSVGTRKGGERDGKSCFYTNFVRKNSPYVPLIKRIRAKSLKLLRYLYDGVSHPVAQNEAILLQELSGKGMSYHCDALKRDQKEPYVSQDLMPESKAYGYGIAPPSKGGKDYWQPHHGKWLKGHALHRAHTALIYLSDDFEGGETRFPYYDIDVTPKQGRVVCFKGTHDHEHGVRPVSKGNRYTFVNWTTNSLGKSEDETGGLSPYTLDEWT